MLGFNQKNVNHRRVVSSHHPAQVNFSKEISRNGQVRAVDSTPKFDYAANLMQMDDIDFDELLECAEENIESSAFFASSV